MRRHLARALTLAVVFAPLLALLATAGPAAADTTYTSTTYAPGVGCDTQYLVPDGVRYVQVVAVGGAGEGGASYDSTNTGGAGGNGATVTAIVPVFPLHPETDGNGTAVRLSVHVGQNAVVGNGGDGGYFAGLPSGGNGGGGGPSIVAYGLGEACPLTSIQQAPGPADPTTLLVVAGGGGGGGAGNTFGSGGAGGSAGFSNDIKSLDGQAGSSAYGTTCGNGGGGGGGTASAAGGGGVHGCTASDGNAGNGMSGGNAVGSGTGASGAGGGGWRGGGSGGSGYSLGGGGGGAGASFVNPGVGRDQQPAAPYTPPVRPVSIGPDTSHTPSVTITPLPTPTTTATLTGATSGNNWFTAAPTVTLTASAAGGPGVDKTYYALDNPTCSPESATTRAACQVYSGSFSVASSGLHTLTYFSLDTLGLDEGVHSTTFVLTPTTAGVTAASIASGNNPSATTNGNIIVSGTGEGTVGTAVYGTNPAGAAAFSSSGAYLDVIAAGSGLTSLTIQDCNLNGGTQVSWWNGTAWTLASNQVYDGFHCVTVTVNSTTTPSLSQLTGSVFGIGSPPSIAATAKTADTKPYTAGTWTNQSVTVTFVCSANATPTASVTRASDGQNQSASGTCTDGLGQTATTTFTGIDVDKTAPTCGVRVGPTVIWSPDGKPVAVTGTVTAGDTLSGLARVLGGAVTSNETLAPGDVRGFAVNATYPRPLTLSTVVNLAGTLVATRAGGANGRVYTQTVTVTDQAGNTTPCTWTVTVSHDQR